MYCVIGEKLAHTLSPAIHGEYFAATGREDGYTAVELTPEQLREGRELLQSYRGVNVTIPYKKAVIPLLDAISDEAREIGAVNTVRNDGGKLTGFNTDPYGFASMLASRWIEPRGKRAFVLGYGGAARSVIFALKSLGADVTVVSREPSGAAADGHNAMSYADLDGESGYLLVNCTPVGMYPKAGKSPVGADVIARFDVLADLIYNPMLTEFLKLGMLAGKRVVGGLYMLVAQAMKSQHIWTGDSRAESLQPRIYTDVSQRLLIDGNIWLIGMPGSGKTTFGKQLAEEFEMTFVDADDFVCEQTGLTIPEMFAKGEDFFRDRESEAIARLACRENVVIATGGGSVLRPFNVDCMRLSGTTVFIDRAPEDIVSDVDCAARPLLADGAQKVFELYERRKSAYAAAAQITVQNNADPDVVSARLKEAIGRGGKI